MDTQPQKIVLSLTIAYFFIELSGGLYYRSLALVTDASFMAINVVGQALALLAGKLSERLPDRDNTFGYERAKVLSGLFNGILVGFLIFYVLIEAYKKIMHPEPIAADKVLIIAILGLAVNAYGLFRFKEHANLMHIKGARLLVLNDTLGSVGVITSSVLIHFTGLYLLDPLAGVLISLLVGYPTYYLIKDSLRILMEGNPSSFTGEDIEKFIYRNFQNVKRVKDLHIWGLSTERIICVARVRTAGPIDHRDTVRSMKHRLMKHFGFSDVFVEEYEAGDEK
ncbi:MAG TPA: cation diffusion facilitator family transporter [Thermodesulfovibrionales bacterium]|jgi:cobalt-zinc-cadmium efflux system protein|nr:cation diffusion facilitator family transporter [Thermodesulfovibrionales bacterium]